MTLEYIHGTKPTDKKYIKNLTKLANFLQINVPPPRFHMASYINIISRDKLSDINYELDTKYKTIAELLNNIPDGYGGIVDFIHSHGTAKDVWNVTKRDYNSCGTVACALGHGPAAGITPKVTTSWFDTSWGQYGSEEFGVDDSSAAWYWLFGPDWEKADNTPQGAAARINLYIVNGVPEDYMEYYTGRNKDLPYEVVPYDETKCEIKMKVAKV